MGTRSDLLTHLWNTVIDANLSEGGLDNVIAYGRWQPEAPFASVGPAIERMLAAGVSRHDICLLRRGTAYEAVFATLYALDDPGVDDGDFLMLHEDLLSADPSGLEGRSDPPAQL